MKKLSLIALTVVLAGCANQEYQMYVESQQRIELARAQAEAARYEALASIANQGDTTSKVAAVMSLQFGSQSGSRPISVKAPTSTSDQVLKWAGLIIPSLVQGYGMYENARVATVQSNNNRDITINNSDNMAATQQHSNATMLGISELITIPEPVVVTQPDPVIVTQPDPIVVTPPDPIVVEPTVVDPVILNATP